MSSDKPLRGSIGAIRNPESDAAIMAAARDLLAEKGYGAFTMSEVARRAHASKPTLYRRWDNKAALIFDLCMSDRTDRLRIAEQGNVAADLSAQIAALWRFWREAPTGTALRAIIAEAQSDDVALRRVRDMVAPGMPEHARLLIEAGIARGELPADFDTNTALRLIVAFNWLHLLTGQIGDETPIAPAVRMLLR